LSLREFRLPDLGEGLTEAEIVTWLVAAGDRVQVDQPLVVVETAKASVDVPSPFAGTVSAIYGAVGDLVPVGSVLVAIDEPDAGAAGGGFREPGVVQAADEASGNVLIGYGTGADRAAPRRARVPLTRSAVPAAPGPRRPASRFASPLVRQEAMARGLDPATIVGSGPGGLVVRADLESAAARSAVPAPAGEDVRVPIRGTRRAAVETLSRSRREIPEATVWVDVDATRLVEARAAVKATRGADEGVSLLGLLAWFCVLGLQRFPELNSRVDTDRGELVLLHEVNLGFAAQTERGLVVPVLRAAGGRDAVQLSAELRRLTSAARAGSLTTAQLTGGTFTVNNYGVFGVDGSAAIINHPEVAILGMGRIIERPWVVRGSVCPRQATELTLTFDHRVCDGATAGGFLRFVADCVEEPVRALV
jgi:2-oxoisovalerate dehydrogenase E2 component (dihydrolipoyl transacylase)